MFSTWFSKTENLESALTPPEQQAAVDSKPVAPQSACPVKHDAKGCKSREDYLGAQGKPLSYIQDPQTTGGSVCPVNRMKDNQIDPKDLVLDPNLPLPTIRQVSSIPRAIDQEQGEDGEYWVYPSQHQFYNAMKRKNFQPSEDDMPVIVSVHNAINERAWRNILDWEKKYKDTCAEQKLIRFEGKSEEYSPRARILNWVFGATLPFDRHDWIVDRCGTEVRYVLDFYSGRNDGKSLMSVHIDVRPALDSFGATFDRVERFFDSLF